MVHLYQPEDTPMTPEGPESGQVSERLLRQALASLEWCDNGRVLVTGRGCDGIVAQISRIGLQVVTGQPNPSKRDAIPDPVPQQANADGHQSSEFLSMEKFEFVVMSDLQDYCEDLLDLRLREATANWLDKLNPGGKLIILKSADSNQTHDAACWARHFACFPGQFSIFEQSVTWLDSRAWRMWWAQRRQKVRPRSELRDTAYVFRIPSEPISLFEWQSHARRGLLTGSRCCRNEATEYELRSHRRSA